MLVERVAYSYVTPRELFQEILMSSESYQVEERIKNFILQVDGRVSLDEVYSTDAEKSLVIHIFSLKISLTTQLAKKGLSTETVNSLIYSRIKEEVLAFRDLVRNGEAIPSDSRVVENILNESSQNSVQGNIVFMADIIRARNPIIPSGLDSALKQIWIQKGNPVYW